jgi:hypothetical protein
MKEGKHLTEDGLNAIRIIKLEMNKNRTQEDKSINSEDSENSENSEDEFNNFKDKLNRFPKKSKLSKEITSLNFKEQLE